MLVFGTGGLAPAVIILLLHCTASQGACPLGLRSHLGEGQSESPPGTLDAAQADPPCRGRPQHGHKGRLAARRRLGRERLLYFRFACIPQTSARHGHTPGTRNTGMLGPLRLLSQAGPWRGVSPILLRSSLLLRPPVCPAPAVGGLARPGEHQVCSAQGDSGLCVTSQFLLKMALGGEAPMQGLSRAGSTPRWALP